MIGSKEFAMMPAHAYFISAARGGVHREDELACALTNREIAGAGLDVWWEEPTSIDHPLLQFDNVIATPHCAGMTHEAMRMMGVRAAEQWIDIFDGRIPPRLMNPQAWPAYQKRFEAVLGSRPPDLS